MRKRKEETANGRRPKKPRTLTSFYGQKIANVGWETPYAPISFYRQPMKATAGGGWAETPYPISFYRQPMKAIANGGWLGTLYAPKGFYGQQTEIIANSGCVERPDHLMGFYGEEEKMITDGCGWEEAPYRRQKKKTGNGEWEGASKSLLSFFREQKKISTTANDSETPNVEEEKQGKGGFFACYLLVSISPRGKGRTYIGFTMDPRRRIRQHNGEIGSGARSTRCGRPWEKVLCVYGFPTKVDALKFEWAWQNPKESTTVCEAAAAFKSLDGVANKIKTCSYNAQPLTLGNPNIVVHYFSTKYEQHSAGCPELPEQMVVQVGSMDELPCYTGELRSWVPNKEEGDERGGPDHSQPLDSLLPMMAASPASSQSMEDFNHGGDWSSTNETEDDEELPPVTERLLISSYKKLGQFEENRDAETLTKELPYATDVMQDFEVPPPLRERLLAASYEKFRQLVEREKTDQTHSLGPSGSQLPTKSSDLTSLPPIGSAVVNLTETESLTGTAVTNEAPAPCELRTCSNEKHLATEAAVDEEKCQSSNRARQAEIIDLLTPPSKCRYRSRAAKTGTSMSSSDIFTLRNCHPASLHVFFVS